MKGPSGSGDVFTCRSFGKRFNVAALAKLLKVLSGFVCRLGLVVGADQKNQSADQQAADHPPNHSQRLLHEALRDLVKELIEPIGITIGLCIGIDREGIDVRLDRPVHAEGVDRSFVFSAEFYQALLNRHFLSSNRKLLILV